MKNVKMLLGLIFLTSFCVHCSENKQILDNSTLDPLTETQSKSDADFLKFIEEQKTQEEDTSGRHINTEKFLEDGLEHGFEDQPDARVCRSFNNEQLKALKEHCPDEFDDADLSDHSTALKDGSQRFEEKATLLKSKMRNHNCALLCCGLSCEALACLCIPVGAACRFVGELAAWATCNCCGTCSIEK